MVLDISCNVTGSFIPPENDRFLAQTVRGVFLHRKQACITAGELIEHEATLQNSEGSLATTTNRSKHHGTESLETAVAFFV
jgi:hypothetical protein